jgi:plastocyanin
MKSLENVAAVVAFVVMLVAIPAAAIAVDATMGHDSVMPAALTTTPMSSSNMAGMSSSGAMMGSATAPAATSAADQLTIVHVQKGCHVWSKGAMQMASMRLVIEPGQMLRIMNQDVDMHRLIELAGPQHMLLGGPMKQGQTDAIRFTTPGVYRFGTKVSPMKGMPPMPTIGPDNTLRLTVTVS